MHTFLANSPENCSRLLQMNEVRGVDKKTKKRGCIHEGGYGMILSNRRQWGFRFSGDNDMKKETTFDLAFFQEQGARGGNRNSPAQQRARRENMRKLNARLKAKIEKRVRDAMTAARISSLETTLDALQRCDSLSDVEAYIMRAIESHRGLQRERAKREK